MAEVIKKIKDVSKKTYSKFKNKYNILTGIRNTELIKNMIFKQNEYNEAFAVKALELEKEKKNLNVAVKNNEKHITDNYNKSKAKLIQLQKSVASIITSYKKQQHIQIILLIAMSVTFIISVLLIILRLSGK